MSTIEQGIQICVSGVNVNSALQMNYTLVDVWYPRLLFIGEWVFVTMYVSVPRQVTKVFASSVSGNSLLPSRH